MLSKRHSTVNPSQVKLCSAMFCSMANRLIQAFLYQFFMMGGTADAVPPSFVDEGLKSTEILWVMDAESSNWQRIAWLKTQQIEPSFDYYRIYWEIFFHSRLAILPEDPDIFERTLFILESLYSKDPQKFLLKLQEVYPEVLINSTFLDLANQWPETKMSLFVENAPSKETEFREFQEQFQLKITEQITQIPEIDKWLKAHHSAFGSIWMEYYRWTIQEYCLNHHSSFGEHHELCQEISNQMNLQSLPQLLPPQLIPGQVPNQPAPKQPNVEITQFSSHSKIQRNQQTDDYFIVLMGPALLLLISSLFLLRNRKWQLGTLLISLFGLLFVEMLLHLWIPPLNQSKSLFGLNQWNITPYQEKDGEFYTQGSYLRSQHFAQNPSKFRLIVLGASSAHGSNELYENSFAGILAKNNDIEVINLAIGGTTSNGILHLMPFVNSLKANAIILYYGHNEMHQFYHYVQQSNLSMQAIALRQILWNSSIYTSLHRLFSDMPKHDMSEITPSTTLEHSQVVTLTNQNFRQNMMQILQNFSQQNIPLLMLNPPTNYPFVDLDCPNPPSSFKTILDYQNCIDQSAQATSIHSSIRHSNKELAQQYNMDYVDLDQYFHQNSPDGTSANSLFWDEIHPSKTGHQWIAEVIQYWLELQENAR